MTVSGSVTIDDMPIPLDWRHQLHDFLSIRLPPENILFARHCFLPKVNPLVCDNASNYFRLPYPPLPPIEIGEYQCPTGMSRYGRALFVVDWHVLKHVAEKCWGLTTVPPGDDVPLDWKTPTGEFSTDSISLKFNGQESTFETRMYPLPPYRIPGIGRSLWLLPLVDARYYWSIIGFSNSSNDDPPESWEAFFESIGESFGTGIDFGTIDIPGEYGNVDERLFKTGQGQPSTLLVDIAAMSVGLRACFNPLTGNYHLYDSEVSKQIRSRRLAATWVSDPDESSPTSPLLISGGRRGAAMYPKELRIWYKSAGEPASKVIGLPRSGVDLYPFNIWTSWETESVGSDPATDDFCQKVADDAWGWMDSGGQYCFLGLAPIDRIFPPEEEAKIVICGFDDYFSIQIKEYPKEPGKYVFVHRYYELPPLFLPDVLLVNGKRNECGGRGSNLAFGDFVADHEEPAGDCPVTQTPPRAALILVTEPPCDDLNIAGQEVVVYDNLGCVFDLPEAELIDARIVFGKGVIPNPYYDNDPGTVETPNPCYDPEPFICVWTAIDRCCLPSDGGSGGGGGDSSGLGLIPGLGA